MTRRFALTLFALPYAVAAGVHALRAVPFGLAPGQISPARHVVFIAVNVAVAALLVTWPRWAVVPLGLFTAQQLWSHGVPLWRGLAGREPVRAEDAAATLFVLATFVLAASQTMSREREIAATRAAIPPGSEPRER